MTRLLIVAAAVWGTVGCAHHAASTVTVGGTAQDVNRAEITDKIDAAWQLRVRGLPQLKAKLAGKTNAEVDMATAPLMERGLPKLSDERIVAYQRLTGLTFTRADAATCASIVTKGLDSEVLRRTLSPEEESAYADIAYEAVATEVGALEAVVRPSLTQAETARAFANMAKGAPASDVVAMANSGQSGSPVKQCENAQAMYRMLDRAPAATKLTVSRSLLQRH